MTIKPQKVVLISKISISFRYKAVYDTIYDTIYRPHSIPAPIRCRHLPSCGCFGKVALLCAQSGRTVSFHFVLHGLVCALSTRRFDRIPVQTALLRPCGTCCEASIGSPSRYMRKGTALFNLQLICPCLFAKAEETQIAILASQHACTASLMNQLLRVLLIPTR